MSKRHFEEKREGRVSRSRMMVPVRKIKKPDNWSKEVARDKWKGWVSQESKYVDTNIAISLTSGVWTVPTLLTGLTEGDDSNGNRDSRHIIFRSMTIRCELLGAISSSQTSALRVLVVYDRDGPNQATPANTDIILSATNIHTPMLLQNGSRFKVLVDQYIFPGTDKNIMHEHRNLSVSPTSIVESYFNSNSTGLVGDINKGALFCLAVGSFPITANFTASVRVRYSDT